MPSTLVLLIFVTISEIIKFSFAVIKKKTLIDHLYVLPTKIDHFKRVWKKYGARGNFVGSNRITYKFRAIAKI